MNDKTYWQRYGHTIAFFKSGKEVYLKREEFQRLIAEWQVGKAFGSYMGVYDFLILIKLSDVYAIMDCTPESLQREEDDAQLKEKNEKEKEKFS